MRLRCLRDEREINVLEYNTLGKGGEAQVYAVDSFPSLAAKVYGADKQRQERASKLLVMRDNPPTLPQGPDGHTPVAWPGDLLCDRSGSVVGFLMPRVHNASQIIDFYNPKTRQEHCPLFDYRYLLRTARNLAAAVRVLHARGYVIGDLKHSNVLVTNTALVTLVDTDSFQITDPQTGYIYACPVRTPDFTPPELQGQKPEGQALSLSHDLFALGVLIFHLLMEGTHPFAGVYEGEDDPPPFEERIAAGHFPYGSRPGPYHPSRRHAPPFGMLAPGIQQLFLQCFDQGHSQPGLRPDARRWQQSLDAAMQSLNCCGVNAQHFYSNHLSACPWCERKKSQLRGIDPFPSEREVLARTPVPSPTPTPVRGVTLVAGGASGYMPPPIAGSPPPVAGSLPAKSGVSAAVGFAVGVVVLFGLLSQIPTNGNYMSGNQIPTYRQTGAYPSESYSGPTSIYNTPIPAATGPVQRDYTAFTLRAVSSNGRYLALASGNSEYLAHASGNSDKKESVRIYDLKSGDWLPEHFQATNISALDFSADGSLLAIGGASGLRICRVTSGKELYKMPTSKPVTAVALSPDGHQVAYATNDAQRNAYPSGNIFLKDLNTWNRHSGKQTILKSDRAIRINFLRFSPNGKWLAEFSLVYQSGVQPSNYSAQQIRTTLWDVASGGHSVQVTTAPYGNNFAFSPDSKRLALVDSHSINIYNTRTGDPIHVLAGEGWLSGLAFSQNGQYLTALEIISGSCYIRDWNSDDPNKSMPLIAVPDANTDPFQMLTLLVNSETVASYNPPLAKPSLFLRTSTGRFAPATKSDLTLSNK